MGHIIEKIVLNFYVCVPLENFIANVHCRVSATFLCNHFARFRAWSLQEIQAMTQIVYFRPQIIHDKQKSFESSTI